MNFCKNGNKYSKDLACKWYMYNKTVIDCTGDGCQRAGLRDDRVRGSREVLPAVPGPGAEAQERRTGGLPGWDGHEPHHTWGRILHDGRYLKTQYVQSNLGRCLLNFLSLRLISNSRIFSVIFLPKPIIFCIQVANISMLKLLIGQILTMSKSDLSGAWAWIWSQTKKAL